MRSLTAEDEAALRSIAERHGYVAARGPHTGEGSVSRLIDALLAGEVVTLALSPADRRRLVTWLDEAPPPEGRLATVLHSLAAQMRPTLPKVAPPVSVPAAVATATTASPARRARRGYLTTDEAARRLELSPARVQELARAREIGRKVDGRWAFTEREITRVQGDRDRRALRLSLAPKRKRTTRRRRSSSNSGSGRPTRADMQAMEHLDRLLAEERRLEQTYSLPFRAPQRVATTIHACARCGQDLLLLIVGDQARDEEDLLAYGRLMREAIVARGLPAYVLDAPEGDGALDDTPSLLLRVWPEPDEPRRVTPGTWEAVEPGTLPSLSVAVVQATHRAWGNDALVVGAGTLPSHTLDPCNTWPSCAGAMLEESSAWGSPVQSGIGAERGTTVGLCWYRPRPMRRLTHMRRAPDALRRIVASW